MGTFLNGLIHIGEYQKPAGRIGELPAIGLSDNLRDLGFEVGRLKTGTPARVDFDSIDLDILEIQFGDNEIVPFSFLNDNIEINQTTCYITYTNKNIHKLIADNIPSPVQKTLYFFTFIVFGKVFEHFGSNTGKSVICICSKPI